MHSDETLGWNCSHVDPEGASVFMSPGKELFSNRPSVQSFKPVESAPCLRSLISRLLDSWGIKLPFCQRRQLEDEVAKNESSVGVEQALRDGLTSVYEIEISPVKLGKRQRKLAFQVEGDFEFEETGARMRE